MSTTIHKVEWQAIEAWLHTLAVTAKDVNAIVGIARGGAVIATALSHLLPSKHLAFATRRIPRGPDGDFYDFTQDRSIRAAALRENFVVSVCSDQGPGFLIVDDVATFGDTLECITEKVLGAVPNADVSYACYAVDTGRVADTRPSLLNRMHYQLRIDNAKTWVTFPWTLTPRMDET